MAKILPEGQALSETMVKEFLGWRRVKKIVFTSKYKRLQKQWISTWVDELGHDNQVPDFHNNLGNVLLLCKSINYKNYSLSKSSKSDKYNAIIKSGWKKFKVEHENPATALCQAILLAEEV